MNNNKVYLRIISESSYEIKKFENWDKTVTYLKKYFPKPIDRAYFEDSDNGWIYNIKGKQVSVSAHRKEPKMRT